MKVYNIDIGEKEIALILSSLISASDRIPLTAKDYDALKKEYEDLIKEIETELGRVNAE